MQKKKQDFVDIIALGQTTKKYRRAERAKTKKREKASSGESGEDESVRCTADAGETFDDDDGKNKKRKLQNDVVATTTVVDNGEASTPRSISFKQLEYSSDKHEDSSTPTQTSSSFMESCQSSRDNYGNTNARDADENSQKDITSVKSHPAKGGPPETRTVHVLETNSGVMDHSSVNQSDELSDTSCPPGVVPDTETDTVIDRGDAQPSIKANPERKSDDVHVNAFKKPHDPQSCTGYLVHIATASSATSRHEETQWAYPRTNQEKLKYQVFHNLWETGYYLTSGCKFGGDFLVYPGDPFLFHSYFIAICVPHDKPLLPLDMITYGRLGTNVKKTVILCSVNEEDKVVYTSLQWTGLS